MSEIYKVENYMDKTFLTLNADMDVYQAVDLLLDKVQTSAVVIDEDSKVVGILSEKDCLKLLTGGSYFQLPGGKVKDFMTKEVFCVPPYTDIFQLADMFIKHFFRRIVVTNPKNKVLGQITRRDLLRIIKELHKKSETKIAPIM